MVIRVLFVLKRIGRELPARLAVEAGIAGIDQNIVRIHDVLSIGLNIIYV